MASDNVGAKPQSPNPLWSNWRKQTIDVSPMYTSIAKPESLHGPGVHRPWSMVHRNTCLPRGHMGHMIWVRRCVVRMRVRSGWLLTAVLPVHRGPPSTETGSVLLQPVSSPRWKASRRPSSLRWRTSWQSWISSSRSTKGGISMSRLLSGGQSTGR